MARAVAVAALLALCACASASPLWDYINNNDTTYSYFDTGVRLGGAGKGWTGYLLNMTSQKWLDETKVSRSVWTHQLVVIVPQNVSFTTTAGLYITGGGNDNPSIPTEDDEDILVSVILATANNVVVATLYQVPNAPIVFAADPTHSGRSEDNLISYSWLMFLTDYDPTWNVLFPMAKSAVRALDTIEDFMHKQFGYRVTKHMVSGGSKRGWTTWLAAAVDPRIIGIAPIVFDMLDFENNVRHMYRAYGGWTFAFQDYWNNNITLLLGTNASAIAAISQIVDPLVLAANLTMPKLVIDATGDEFFMPDDNWLWWGKLPGETNLLMIANAEHSEATGLLTLLPGASAFFQALLTNTPRPKFSWTMDHSSGNIVITSDTKPFSVTLRFATTYDAMRRDFRLIKGNTPQDPCTFIPVKVFGNACINPVLWQFEDVAPDSYANGVYTYTLTQPLPPAGWRAFLGELHFPGPNGQDFIMTTQVSIIPNTFPFPNCEGVKCKGFLV